MKNHPIGWKAGKFKSRYRVSLEQRGTPKWAGTVSKIRKVSAEFFTRKPNKRKLVVKKWAIRTSKSYQKARFLWNIFQDWPLVNIQLYPLYVAFEKLENLFQISWRRVSD